MTNGIYEDHRESASQYEKLPGYRPPWARLRKQSRRKASSFWVWAALFMALIAFGVLLTYLMTLP